MDKEDIHLGDWASMFVGEVPGSFYIELTIRTIFVYCLLVTAMRIMGKRMAAQTSRNELAALVTLAAAIGVPLQDPARGLLPPIIIASVVVITGSLIARYAFRSPKFEHITQGEADLLVEDGRIQLHTLKKIRMSKNRLFAALRQEGIKNLGEVKYLYMEAGGAFSLVRNSSPKPGLGVIPGWDKDLIQEQHFSKEILVCTNCGTTTNKAEQATTCPQCSSTEYGSSIE